MRRKNFFTRFAKRTARATGHPLAFAAALLVIIAWIVTGPIFDFSNTWQLVINTGTTILTFLMVFLIQNTQNRESQTIQIKLDELIRTQDNAHNALLNLDQLTDEELERLLGKYEHLAYEARKALRKGVQDLGTPEV